ncbi:MAG: RsmB/NOP family class I SAM-dependent RNA methyltransferase [Lachnospiraceae bacterium]|nr:RsmB/NOP family class I SAM-dependent RNA methyltransferase [Lachnospiraceae bacterium]
MNRTDLPIEYARRMEELLGDEYDAYLASLDKPLHKGLRVNSLKTDGASVMKLLGRDLKPVPWASLGYYYNEDEIKPGKSPYFEAGLYYIQEPSAMSVAEIAMEAAKDLGINKPELKVLDLCAAPGGKTTYLAALMENKGLLVANEINAGRAAILSQNVERCAITNTVVISENPVKLADRFENYFDLIVVDAPCSGEGMFRKEEDALSMWSPDNVKMCAERQKEITHAASKMLKGTGRIVYSTCTFAMEEDENLIKDFLDTHEDFKTISSPYKKYFKEGFEPVRNGMRLFPHLIDGEGHFACVLGRDEDVEETRPYKKKGNDRNTLAMMQVAKKFFKENFSEGFWERFEGGDFISFGDNLYLMPVAMNVDKLKVLRPGLELGTVVKERFIPSHALSLIINSKDVKISLSMAEDEVTNYLKGLTLNVNEPRKDGWALMCVDGYSIGWGKKVGNTIKNHYPKGLRWN